MKYFNLVMIVMVLMLSFSRLVWAGEQEEFKVWQIEKKIGEVQREWNEIVGKDKRLVELKARAEALGIELQKANENKQKSEGK